MLHVHPHSVQRPTHSNLHVRDIHDAHVILEAVRLHRLQPVTRRLNEVERMSFIRSGSVFVWEESDDDTGLRRWTDGLLWSASRMREPFLFYETRTLNPRYPPANVPGLVKQTYSAIVTLPSPPSYSNTPPTPPVMRKWHLTAYFEQADLGAMITVDNDPMLANIVVPQGVYRSGKSRQKQQHNENAGGYRWINIDGSGGNINLVSSSNTTRSSRSSTAMGRGSTSTSSRSVSPNDGSGSPSPSHSPSLRHAPYPPPTPVSPSAYNSSFYTSHSHAHARSHSRSSAYESPLSSTTTPAQLHYSPTLQGQQQHSSHGFPSTQLPPIAIGFNTPIHSPMSLSPVSTVSTGSARPPMIHRTSSDTRSREDERVISLLNAGSASSLA